MAKNLFAMSLCLMFVPAHASAGWHGAEWGMAYDELAVSGVPPFYSLSDEEAVRHSNPNDGEAVFGFKTEMKENQGYFLFKDKRLSAVRLELGDFKLTDIVKNNFLKQQGKPEYKQEHILGYGACRDESYAWSDLAHNNKIAFYRHRCKDGSLISWVIYTPLN
jgi:hypothetical protein